MDGSVMELHITTTQCHLPWRSHSVTCHLEHNQTGQSRFNYPGRMEGWVDLGDLLRTEMVSRPQPVTYPSTNRSQCRLTTLIKANVLTATLRRSP